MGLARLIAQCIIYIEGLWFTGYDTFQQNVGQKCSTRNAVSTISHMMLDNLWGDWCVAPKARVKKGKYCSKTQSSTLPNQAWEIPVRRTHARFLTASVPCSVISLLLIPQLSIPCLLRLGDLPRQTETTPLSVTQIGWFCTAWFWKPLD